MRILVTGAAGLIGTHLCAMLRDQGHELREIDIRPRVPGDIGYGSPIVIEDLSDPASQLVVASMQAECVYHLACHPYEGLSQFCPYLVGNSTYNTTLNTLAGAIESGTCKKFIYASSMARYGSGFSQKTGQRLLPPFRESLHTTHPEDIYGIAKVAAEQSVSVLCNLHRIKHNIVVPHNVYGYGSEYAIEDPYRGFILIWINRLLKGLPILIYGDGTQTRAPSWIGDFTPTLARFATEDVPYRVVNIGAKQFYTLNKISEIVREEFTLVTGKRTLEPEYRPMRPCEVSHAFCATDLASEILDYEDATTLRDAINQTIRWAHERHPNGIECRYMEDYEVEITSLFPEVWGKKEI